MLCIKKYIFIFSGKLYINDINAEPHGIERSKNH